MTLRPLALLALVLSAPALASELTPQRLAEIQRAEAAALEKVHSDFGNKKPSELSASERSAYIRRQNEALNQVHAELKVDTKRYARTLARQTRAEREALHEAQKALEDGKAQPGTGVEVIGAEPAPSTVIDLDAQGEGRLDAEGTTDEGVINLDDPEQSGLIEVN